MPIPEGPFLAERKMFRMQRDKALKSKGRSKVYEAFLHLLSSNTEMAHAYETLISGLHHYHRATPLKTLLLTSTQPEEGKTTVAINLALTMLLAGKKTLIIDFDLRKPKLHKIFSLENTAGFADILYDDRDIKDIVQNVKINMRAPIDSCVLSVITSGQASAQKFTIVDPLKLKEILAYLGRAFDIVLFDSPPVLSVNDALLLAPIVDGIILVLNIGAVTERDVLEAKARFTHAGGHILGVVLNRFNEKLHGPGFHPYQSYYL
jgi:capsular exopolysaccharide synthesis family protein